MRERRAGKWLAGLVLGLAAAALFPSKTFAADVAAGTLEELETAIGAAADETTITVTEDIDVTSTIEIPSGKDIILTGTDDAALKVNPLCGYGIEVESGGSLTLKGITLDGEGHASNELIRVSGSLTMEDGASVQDNGETGVWVGRQGYLK